jgi:hypothetical protein
VWSQSVVFERRQQREVSTLCNAELASFALTCWRQGKAAAWDRSPPDGAYLIRLVPPQPKVWQRSTLGGGFIPHNPLSSRTGVEKRANPSRVTASIHQQSHHSPLAVWCVDVTCPSSKDNAFLYFHKRDVITVWAWHSVAPAPTVPHRPGT